MVEFIGYGIGGVGVVSTVFMWGHTVATKSKLEGMVKKDECIKYRDDLNNKLGTIHEKINTVAIGVARIEGLVEKYDKPK